MVKVFAHESRPHQSSSLSHVVSREMQGCHMYMGTKRVVQGCTRTLFGKLRNTPKTSEASDFAQSGPDRYPGFATRSALSSSAPSSAAWDAQMSSQWLSKVLAQCPSPNLSVHVKLAVPQVQSHSQLLTLAFASASSARSTGSTGWTGTGGMGGQLAKLQDPDPHYPAPTCVAKGSATPIQSLCTATCPRLRLSPPHGGKPPPCSKGLRS